MKSLGQGAFEAYELTQQVPGLPWSLIPENIRAQWQAVGEAVRATAMETDPGYRGRLRAAAGQQRLALRHVRLLHDEAPHDTDLTAQVVGPVRRSLALARTALQEAGFWIRNASEIADVGELD